MRMRFFGRYGAHAFGTFGLLLMLVMAKLARYEAAPHHSYPQRTRAWLARRAMDAIGAFGWLVDQLPTRSSERSGEPKLDRARVNAGAA